MKRSWIGFALLAILLAGSLFSSWTMEEIHKEAAQKLEQAADFSLNGRWPEAAFLAAQAEHRWDKWTLLRSAQADHTPMEEIDTLFSVLEVYGKARERAAFAAVCRETAKKIQAMGDAHSLKLENLL